MEKKFQVGENYLVREDAEAKPERMIDNTDDILRILKTSDDPLVCDLWAKAKSSSLS